MASIARVAVALLGFGLAGWSSVCVAGNGSAAQPIRPESWVGSDDYPTEDFQLGHEGKVTVRVSIDGTGSPISCSITDSSGWPGLDKASCSLMLVRGRFEPAKDESGAAVASTFSRKLAWRMPGSNRVTMEKQDWSDIQVSVSRLPVGDEAKVVVRQVISATGTVETCVTDDATSDQKLVAIACQQAASAAKPITDLSGRSVRSLQPWRVLFLTKALPDDKPMTGGPTFVRGDLASR